MAARGQAAEEQLVGKRLFHLFLDQPRHRARAHGRVVAMFGEPGTRGIVELDRDVLVGQLRLQLEDELVHHMRDGGLVQRLELDGGVQTIAEFRAEQAFDFLQLVAGVILLGETDAGAAEPLGAGIGRQHQDDIAEIGLATVVVRERAMVHDLQQQVEYVRVRLLDLVHEQHRMRMLDDGLGQQAALVEADVTGRRADQARDGMPLHVLRHVEADEFQTHDARQLPRDLGLADARGPGEQIGADRLFRMAEAGARHLDRGRQRLDGVVLPEHHHLEITFERLERLAVGGGNRLGRNARDLGDDVLDVVHADGLLAAARRQQVLAGTGLVNHVNRLVRQVAVVDVTVRQFHRAAQRLLRVAHAVMVLEAVLQAAQDFHRLLDRGLGDVNLLEAA